MNPGTRLTPPLHDWDLDPGSARALQVRLRGRVIAEDRLDRLERLAGIDVGFEDGGRTARAAVVVLGYPSLEPLEQAISRQPTRFPYVPGLLSFRELPVVLEALAQLAQAPDLILCDGQGQAIWACGPICPASAWPNPA